MKTHYFIGIKIPPTLAISILEARSNTNLHVTHKVLPVEEELHITLFYLGQIELNLLDQLIQSLRNIDWNSFDLTTNCLDFFGSKLTPRVVYVALEESKDLRTLQQNVMRIISNHIDVVSSNDYIPHITIAKKWASKGQLSVENFQFEKITFEVNNFSIFQINPTSIPRYEDISTIQCGGGKENGAVS